MDNRKHKNQNIDRESGEIIEEKTTANLKGYDIDLHLPKLEDNNHPLIPEVNQDYILREINGQTDLELLSFVLEDSDFFTMIEGEAATGKNLSIRKIASECNWPCVRVNFSISSSYESLVGRFAPVDTSDIEKETFNRSEVIESVGNRLTKTDSEVKNPYQVAENAIPEARSFGWVDGILTKAVKNGWFFVADEINSANPDALMPLNGLTESRKNRYLTIEEKSEVIEPHDRFRFIATRNPVSYAGTGEMNSALESRAYIIPFDHHNDDALKEILKNKTDIVENGTENALDSLINLAQNIRTQEQAGTQYVTKISTRDLIKVGKLTNIMSIREATATVFLGVADETDETPIENEIAATNFY